jgi:hypothetical protein
VTKHTTTSAKSASLTSTHSRSRNFALTHPGPTRVLYTRPFPDCLAAPGPSKLNTSRPLHLNINLHPPHRLSTLLSPLSRWSVSPSIILKDTRTHFQRNNTRTPKCLAAPGPFRLSTQGPFHPNVNLHPPHRLSTLLSPLSRWSVSPSIIFKDTRIHIPRNNTRTLRLPHKNPRIHAKLNFPSRPLLYHL